MIKSKNGNIKLSGDTAQLLVEYAAITASLTQFMKEHDEDCVETVIMQAACVGISEAYNVVGEKNE